MPSSLLMLSALLGARDWITVAALITLAHLAEENREIELDVRDAFKTPSEFIPDGGKVNEIVMSRAGLLGMGNPAIPTYQVEAAA